uniref:Uncharacterized protein n=2 Tax=Picea TaxID=3328 RepID=A0A101LY13_PICGL|nr:hypothetical protein ABT39_MTgene5478 [Picea glauca]QHR91541.1 hypothetical protein Q903MT_gene5576 [Picea sitchensis]
MDLCKRLLLLPASLSVFSDVVFTVFLSMTCPFMLPFVGYTHPSPTYLLGLLVSVVSLSSSGSV